MDKIKNAVEELADKHQLSSRQQEVLLLMARGQGTNEIAQEGGSGYGYANPQKGK